MTQKYILEPTQVPTHANSWVNISICSIPTLILHKITIKKSHLILVKTIRQTVYLQTDIP